MSKSAMNLQDSFLNQVRRENTEVKILLVNGSALRGIVKGFDNFTVILTNRSGQHLIYKHAIAQLVSHRVGGARNESDNNNSADKEDNADELGEPVAAAVEADPPARPAKPRKEGFNTLDLSSVKLGGDSKGKN